MYAMNGFYADAFIFGTCLYVGAAAFIIEFQGSPLVCDRSHMYVPIGTKEIIFRIRPLPYDYLSPIFLKH